MDENNQPRNVLLAPLEELPTHLEPLVWGVPCIGTRVPIHVRNSLLQERLRLPPRTFV
jgi:hypothetical protein